MFDFHQNQFVLYNHYFSTLVTKADQSTPDFVFVWPCQICDQKWSKRKVIPSLNRNLS